MTHDHATWHARSKGWQQSEHRDNMTRVNLFKELNYFGELCVVCSFNKECRVCLVGFAVYQWTFKIQRTWLALQY